MCASLWRPMNAWSSDALSIHLSSTLVSFTSSFLSFPLLLYNRLPTPHFLLSKFISIRASSPFFSPLLPHHIPRCLSRPPLPPNALRLTTLFSFKIKIIKSAVKWERVCAAGVTMQHFDVLFQHDSINISSSVPNHCCTHSHTITPNICTIHALAPHVPPTTSFLFTLLLQYEERLIWRTKLYCFGSDFLSSNHSILYCWSHPLLFLFSFPLQTSPLSFLILCLSPSLSPPPSYSWSAGC